MIDKKIIRGAGGGGKGGGGGGRVAVEDPDSLRSIAYASVLDLVSEGEIEGLANGLQSVYFDETPLQNPDGTFNFSGATVVSTTGTQAQSYVEGFPSVENEVGVGTEVKYATPIVRQISNAETDAVRVRVSVPVLTNQDTTNGDLHGSKIEYAIDVQSDGGGYVPQVLSPKWDTTTADVVSATSAISNVPTYGMSVFVKSSIDAVYSVQYKLQSEDSSAWRNDAFVEYKDQNMAGKFGFLISSILNMIGRNSWAMSNQALGLWEIRLIVTSGTAEIIQASGNIGSTVAVIEGKTTSKYERSYRIKLTGDAPWDIRVRRVTPDSTSAALQNKTYWESYTEIVDGKFRYPNSAIVGIRIDSSQFNNIPKRSYDLKLLKVKIPSNYNPETRVYTGIWDGTFDVAWTDNPAWCFYDLITNARYGLGDYIAESQVDKWTLYEIGKYCDELVDDGFGGTEPRFTCNLYLQTRQEAYSVINSMASIFRGMPFWSSGSITLGHDAPSDPVYQYTNSNVIDGNFNYSGSALKARHTVALVTWNDPEDFYRQKVEYVEDADGINRYGITQTEVIAVGCTSRGQANRVGRWLLYTEQNESELVTFKTGLEGNIARPSQIIQVADEMRAGKRIGGRIVSATTSSLVLDANVSTLTNITTGTISVILANGSLETRSISSVNNNTITVSSSFSTAPTPNSIWMIQTTSLVSQLFKVVSVAESEDGFSISALEYNPSKYNFIEQGLKLQERTISSLSQVPSSPTNLSTVESLYTQASQVKVLVTLSWSPVSGATQYEVSYKIGTDNYITLPLTSSTSIDIRDTTSGDYTFKVSAINSINKKSIPAQYTSTIYGKTLPPSDVSTLDYAIDPNIGITLEWLDVTDVDIDYYEIRKGDVWENAEYLAKTKASYYKLNATEGGNQTYLVKALDTSGNYSVNASSISINVGIAPAPVVYASFEKDTLGLHWNSVQGDYATSTYEIRTGSTWNSAVVIGSVNTTYFRTKIDFTTSKNYLVAAKDIAGNYGGITSINVEVVAPINTSSASYVYADTSLTNATVTIDWNEVTPVHGLSHYEITYDSITKSVGSNTITLPADWIGNRNFVIQTVDLLGNKSIGYTLLATKLLPNSPSNFRAQVIDNSLLFYWTLPIKTSLPISHTLLKRGETWETASSIGTKSGEFTSYQESVGGEYKYWIAVVDTDNNESIPVSLTATVAEPPDFVFHGEFISDLTGTLVNAVQEENHVVLPVNTSETWSQHFSTRSWASPQAQVNAGYPYYAQPTISSGYYEETFDYGTILASSKVTIDIDGTIVTGSPSVVITLSTSIDNSTWVNFEGVSSVYASNFRYVKIKVQVTQTTDTCIYEIHGITARLDAKQRTDAGTQSCLSTDTDGTIANFTKEFVDVTSINLTPSGTSSVTAVYDFQDAILTSTYSVSSNVCTVTATGHGLITGQNVRLYFSSGSAPSGIYTVTGYTTNTFTVSITTANTTGNCLTYPQGFRIYLFDSSGTRVSGNTSWSVRGY